MELNDKETAELIRGELKKPRGPFSWVTDGAGYKQHMRFVKHRNEKWEIWANNGGTWKSFCVDYADRLEGGEIQ